MTAKNLLIYLCSALLAVPFPAIGATPRKPLEKTGLKCVADPRNKSNPYHRMKEANDRQITNTINKGGLQNRGQLPRKDMMKLINDQIGVLCPLQDQLMLTAATISMKERKLDANTVDAEGCNAYAAYDGQVKTFDTQVKDYHSKLDTAYKSLNAKMKELIANERTMLADDKDNAKVAESFLDAWGTSFGSNYHTASSLQKGAISHQLQLIHREAKAYEKLPDGYKNIADAFKSLKDKCTSLIGDENWLAGAAPKDTVDPNALPKEAPAADPKPGEVDNTVVPPEGPPEDPITQPPADDKKGGVGEWASKNKGLLILGAGAAAVGGLLWYKNKKDKEDDVTNDLPIIDAPNATVTTTATATATNTITDANGYSLSASGFPVRAIAGQKIGTIVVTVNGPSGGASPDGIQVSLGCVASCPISGSVTKTVSGGKAEFNDISFTSTQVGVQLRVSAPGMNSITSPGSFNVTAE